MKRRTVTFGIIVLGLVILLGAGYWAYRWLAAPTRVGFIAFKEQSLAEFAEAAADLSFVTVEKVPWGGDASPSLTRYDVLMVQGMGLRLEPEEKTRILEAINRGVPVYVCSATTLEVELTSLTPEQMQAVQDYYGAGGNENYRRMLNYLRREIDGKRFFVDAIEPPAAMPRECFYHYDGAVFNSFEAYLEYYRSEGFYREGAPRVCLTATRGRPGGSDQNHVYDMIRALEASGLNVFPIYASARQQEFIRAVGPDLIVEATGAGQQVEFFRELNVPVFCPVSVYQDHDAWLQDQRGFSGGLLTWNIVWPEMDGRIVPYAVAAQFPGEHGFQVFKALPERLDKWVALVNKYIALRRKGNAEKRVAIIYYKGPGENALSAEGLEVGESLFNVLAGLRDAGYTVEGLPESADELLAQIQLRGRVLGAYAEGAIDEFLDRGDPALIPAEQYEQWAKSVMPPEVYDELTARYGPPPGNYLSKVSDGRACLAVSRIEFGNVAILPLPMAGAGDDTNQIVHGTKAAPPHAYIGVYLWARFGFQADALVHFGTHGSVEFTPWKQNALSDYDWPDILTGGLPHSYIYSINNIGEAVLAKRRSYAVMISHLTAPFMSGDLYGDLEELHRKFEEYERIEDEALRLNYQGSICELANRLNLGGDLQLGELAAPLPEETLERLHNHLHQVSSAKVSRGRYVLGRPYSDAEAMETVRMMANDPAARGFADLDVLKGKITAAQADDLHFFNVHYLQQADRAIAAIFRGETRPEDFLEPVELALLEPAEPVSRMGSMPRGERSEKPSPALLLQRLASRPELLEYLRSLRDDERFAEAVLLTEPRNLAKEKRLAENLPERGERLRIVSDDDIQVLLAAMKEDSVREEVFRLLGDPEFIREMQASRQRETERSRARRGALIADLAGREARFEVLALQDPAVLAEQREELKKLAADCEFLVRVQPDFPDADFTGTLERVQGRLAECEKQLAAYRSTVTRIYETLSGVEDDRRHLQESGRFEMEALLNSLAGGYVSPSPGGDPIVNPRSIPTGRNLYPIDDQAAPTREAWETGKQMAQALIDVTLAKENRYPHKVAFTLWGGEFIRTYGTAIGQIFYLLGVEPVWNSRGVVADVRLIPMEQLKRPRIDVVIQTSGQFRDAATSRIYLIDKAIRLAGGADDAGEYGNYIREGNLAAEKVMIERGLSPAQARRLAAARIFGGVNGNYGTGITGLVEAGDRWEDEQEIAERYLNNMGAVYSEENWSEYLPGVFEAALQNTDTVVHPRSSNTTGPLSLDHVYEFMGGINLTIRNVTGRDPDAYFLDLRQPGKAAMTDAREASMIEARSTILNPKYITEMMEEGPTAAGIFAETTRNLYGWEVMKPEMLEDHLWQELKSIYVDDSLGLDIREYFEAKNPYALQEMTAVMLETIRKGYWQADQATREDIARLHAELVADHRPGCSGFVCDNAMLKGLISSLLGDDTRKQYESALERTLQAAPSGEEVSGLKLEEQKPVQPSVADLVRSNLAAILIAAGVMLLLLIAIFVSKHRKTV